jgi:hypothetical protein
MNHVTYPDYLYANISSVTTTSVLTPRSNINGYTSSLVVFSIASAQTTPLYSGQWIKLIDRNDPTYYFTAIVQSHDNTTGRIEALQVASNFNNSYNFDTGFSICVDRLNYVDDIEPAHVFITATSKHIAIQCRNTTGEWHDFHAVMECENPFAVEDASILTTGYMLGNSGYTRNWAAHHNWVYNSQVYNSIDAIGYYNGTTILNSGTNGSIGPAVKQQTLGKSYLWTGPFSMPSTRKGTTNHDARIMNSIITPLGQAKTIGQSAILGYDFSNSFSFSTTLSSLNGQDLER